MVENAAVHMWAMRVIYVTLVFLVIFFHLLPLQTLPLGWAGPDILLALTIAWVLRRPEFVPPVLIALVFLLCDLMFHRPPGLWAALVLIGCETLRARHIDLRDLTFAMEWASVTTTLVTITLIYRAILAVLVVDQAPLGLSLMQLVATLIAYPLVVVVSQSVFGVRKLAPGDIDALGGRT
ncbi:rod shape-determining protein MreD [Roseovarius rhodophyticola]|uniref:Rod shape-determining protein MreD n=1 Tax=Roseovarius rhodophyticola TaxID=3080827 RepID=A0ABZ2THU2_9RHOB|nr:rod shape-determining protein MreD [Roseovarius sp. W115]MDV2929446.1 rod shape-determining protein MreD [Roseovarius sp. W115]